MFFICSKRAFKLELEIEYKANIKQQPILSATAENALYVQRH
ncbi:hypothetical protein N473_19270 [Pseudoalteromonas luteoviolacea CPMOR-1]|uniref:Uncharacterized protein n=1 Tax=Pseudoalteromonas luteoviolacea CPMOR-1 TaxID=1365248 RepID=A0A167KB00_9GAMM|nr:hypothetical protein N473_19270 [Pseudoalteromonas luteoviolacea CPMOR-1]